MSAVSSLPASFVARFKQWKQSGYAEQAEHYATLAEGQSPQAMVISCCDSRVLSTEIFNAPAGTFFIHRNIANLVPPYAPNSDFHGTAAAVEYAVKALKVPHLIIMGHSACGGVQACYDLCEGEAAPEDSGFEFVGHWLDVLRPAYARVSGADDAARAVSMGHQGVIGSLENLMGYPFVADAVAAGTLSLHGLWHDIGPGELYELSPESNRFEKL
ncbi:MAG: carbonic anhydrase [PS1 clade bacterium]|uniref:Carbonic anhydrase n=1 Tax=PS1 clade bacterium TaxID=2175152 RepID=A0A937HIU3_9PROT|nr:carbonic anhydrase [PS1 clade bacterium]